MQDQSFKKSVWDYLFYASMLVLAVWLVLKVFGIINTPVWLEYWLPLGSFLLAFFTFYQSLADKFTLLATNYARVEVRLNHIKRDIEWMKSASSWEGER